MSAGGFVLTDVSPCRCLHKETGSFEGVEGVASWEMTAEQQLQLCICGRLINSRVQLWGLGLIMNDVSSLCTTPRDRLPPRHSAAPQMQQVHQIRDIAGGQCTRLPSVNATNLVWIGRFRVSFALDKNCWVYTKWLIHSAVAGLASSQFPFRGGMTMKRVECSIHFAHTQQFLCNSKLTLDRLLSAVVILYL